MSLTVVILGLVKWRRRKRYFSGPLVPTEGLLGFCMPCQKFAECSIDPAAS